MAIPKRVAERIASRVKTFTPVLQAQKDRDVSEADTVTLVKDLLADVFGFDKYAELTSEHAIRGTYCDLAIQFDGKLQMLLEVKSIGSALQDRHIKQSIDYAANQGMEWVVLTNGAEWVLYHVLFRKPIEHVEVTRFNLLACDPKRDEVLEQLFLVTKEGLQRKAPSEFRERQDATNRYTLAAIVLNSDDVLNAIRREVRRLSEHLVEREAIQAALRSQVIKREALEGPQADAAEKRVMRSAERRAKERSAEEAETEARQSPVSSSAPPEAPTAPAG